MKKILYISLLVFIFGLVQNVAYAQKGSGSGNAQSSGDQTRLQDPTTHEASQVGSVKTQQSMSTVSEAVKSFLETSDNTNGIGKQVSDIAKQQQGAQQQMGKALTGIESRVGLAKKLFGPNYKAIKEMKKLMEQNQLRIQQLQQLQNQTQNQGEETQLREMIQAMTEQNTALQSQVQAEEGVKSAFGWLIKLFN
jgi:hypothetical protein